MDVGSGVVTSKISPHPELSKAVMRQMPVSMQAPSSRAAQAYEELAAKLLNKEAEQSVAKRGMAAFFSHMISGKR